MSLLRSRNRFVIGGLTAMALGIGLWQASVALADTPKPNPLAPGANAILSPVPGVDLASVGDAATMHGDPVAGRQKFVTSCASCHGDRGTVGIANPGSDDGTVPPLNPIDPGFVADSQGNAAIFAREIDTFLQHGSRPAGKSPQVSMLGFGDHNLMPQRDIADIEAYVMQLNGTYWSDRWAPPVELQMDATRSDGDVSYVTYRITLVNHSAGVLGKLRLQDSLPPGTTYIASFVPGPGENPGKMIGNTLEWDNAEGIPQGKGLGPFYVLVQLQDPKAVLAPNSAWLSFNWVGWDGTTTYPSTAASALTLPSPVALR